MSSKISQYKPMITTYLIWDANTKLRCPDLRPRRSKITSGFSLTIWLILFPRFWTFQVQAFQTLEPLTELLVHITLLRSLKSLGRLWKTKMTISILCALFELLELLNGSFFSRSMRWWSGSHILLTHFNTLAQRWLSQSMQPKEVATWMMQSSAV